MSRNQVSLVEFMYLCYRFWKETPDIAAALDKILF